MAPHRECTALMNPMAYSNRFFTLAGVHTYSESPTFWENCVQREYSRAV